MLHVIYKNHTEEEITYPIKNRTGMEVYSLLSEKFRSKEGLLTYQAQIKTPDGEVYREWTHQLWVHLIKFDEESATEAARTSDSVSSQPKQESVTETP